MDIKHRHIYTGLLLLVAGALLGVSGWQALAAALQPPAVQMVRIATVANVAPTAAVKVIPIAASTPALPATNQIALASATATIPDTDDPVQPIAYAATSQPTVAAQPPAETVITLPTVTPEPPATPGIVAVATPIIVTAATPVQTSNTPAVAQHYNGAGVPIMMYHHIAVPPANADTIRIGLSVTPPGFAAQLDYLSSHGYQTITLARYVDWMNATRLGQPAPPLPANPIVLTFDDGYDDIYANAYPLLLQHGMVGTFHVITGKVGWDGYMSWPQLQAMSAAGMDIESHTVDHINLDSLGTAQLNYELTESKAQLEAHIGKPVTIICYPAGHYNGAVAQAAQLAGYSAATTTRYGWSYPSADPMQLPRVRVAGDEALAGFAASIGGTLTYKENR